MIILKTIKKLTDVCCDVVHVCHCEPVLLPRGGRGRGRGHVVCSPSLPPVVNDAGGGGGRVATADATHGVRTAAAKSSLSAVSQAEQERIGEEEDVGSGRLLRRRNGLGFFFLLLLSLRIDTISLVLSLSSSSLSCIRGGGSLSQPRLRPRD